MQQYAFQNNNQINNNQQQQPQNINNNNNGNAALQHQMTQAQQIQQYQQGQMSQLQQMQQQFNQFNINQQPPAQNQPNAPQNQLYQQQQQNIAQQQQQNIAHQQQQNKSQLYQQQQAQQQQQQQSPQNTQNQQMQQNLNNAIVNNTFAQNQNQMQLQAQQAQQAHNQNAQNPQLNVAWAQTQQFQQIPSQITQLDNTGAPQQQQQQQMIANGDINTTNNQQMGEKAVDSKLDPEVAAFNPLGLGDQPASFQQQTIQEQLFAQLQTINTQMHNIKYQTDNVLTPTLLQLNQQMALLQSNPAMLQLHANQVHYFTIQQNQMVITSQINRNQMTFQQLEQNLKYTQDMYHKNKDEQYVVSVDENADNQNVINLNEINNAVQGKTFNLTQGVTDVGVGGNAWTQQQQQENAQPVPPQPVHAQPVQPEDGNNMQQEISTNESSEGGEDQSDRDTDSAQPEPPNQDQIQSESESQNEIDPQSNDMNDNEPIDDNECVDDEEISSDDHENDSQNASPSPRALHPNEVSPQPIQISPFTRKVSKFGASGNKPFGYSLTTPDEAEAEPQELETENSTESPPIPSPDHNALTQPMYALNLSKSVVFPPNNRLQSKPLMEKAASYSSQHSNDASSDTTPQIWRVQDDDIEPEPGIPADTEMQPNGVRYDVMTLVQAQKQYLTIQWSRYKEIPRSVRTVSKGVNPERYMEDVVAMFMRKSANPWLAASHTGLGPSCKGEKLIKKLTGILNKMTPEKFSKIAKSSMDIVNDFAETREQMKTIIGLVLQFGIKQPVFGGQYALLCSHLHAHLPKLGMICEYAWVVEDNDVSQTFRKMVIQQTNDLFMKHSQYTADDGQSDDEGKALSRGQLDLRKKKKKDNFFAVMVLVAELYNVELIKRNLVFKGVFEILLKKPSAVDLEGLCRLFKRCGAKLDVEAKKYVDKYLQKLIHHSRKFDFRTKILVEQIKEMRSNGWEHRLKKEVAKTKDEIKEDFEKEQMAKNSGKHHRDRGYADRRPRKRDDYYEEDYGYGYEEDYNASRGSYGHSASNLRKVKGDRYGGRGGGGGGRGGGGGGRRRDERSRSSINLRSGSSIKKGRYHDSNSWGNDDSAIDGRKSNKSNGNGRYKQKYVMEKVKVSQPGKSYGMYQKKSSSGNSGVSKKSMDSVERNGGNAKAQSYGDSGTIRRLSGFIDEYMVSGELSDILDFNCSDLKVWASVINDGLRDRKTAQIADFIEFILVMFEQNVLHNKNGSFVDKVVKYLVMVLDESSMDSPKFTQYVAELFANLCHCKYLKADACYSAFVKMYKEYSEYDSFRKKKTINKFIKHSVNELKNLQASRSLISSVQRKAA